jgi:hypothetical protein
MDFAADASTEYYILVSGKMHDRSDQGHSRTGIPSTSGLYGNAILSAERPSRQPRHPYRYQLHRRYCRPFSTRLRYFCQRSTNNLDLRITATVPPDATSGPIVVVTPHGNVTSTSVFQVLRPTLAIARSSPTELTLSWTRTPTARISPDLRNWTQIATLRLQLRLD